MASPSGGDRCGRRSAVGTAARRSWPGFGCVFGLALPARRRARWWRRPGSSSRTSGPLPALIVLVVVVAAAGRDRPRVPVDGRDARRARRGHPPGRGRRLLGPRRADAARAAARPPARRRLRHDGRPARDRRAPAADPAGRGQPRAADAADGRPGQPRGDRRRRLPARPRPPRGRARRDARARPAHRRPAHARPVRGRARSRCTANRPTRTSSSPMSCARSSRPPRRPGSSSAAAIDGDLPIVDIDPVRIREVLANLVANALRHTPPGGRVTRRPDRSSGRPLGPARGPSIRARASTRRCCRTSSTGSSTATTSRGSGLGLAIARQLVVAHGGEIAAESPPGRGTTIRVRLPLTGD